MKNDFWNIVEKLLKTVVFSLWLVFWYVKIIVEKVIFLSKKREIQNKCA